MDASGVDPMTSAGGNARCISSRAARVPVRDAVSVSMIESDSGSTLIEYALIAALVSIVLVAISRDLYFPQAPVVALSAVAAPLRAAGSPTTGAPIQPRSRGGETSIARARGAGSSGSAGMGTAVSIAGAPGSELGQGIPPIPVADVLPPSRGPDLPKAARSEAAAIPQTTPPQTTPPRTIPPRTGDPTAAARPPEPAEGTKDENARDSGSRPTRDGNTAGNPGPRRLATRLPARPPGPAAEQLAALEPGAVAAAPATAAAGLGGLSKDLGDRTIRKTGALSAPRSSHGSVRSAEPRGEIARDAVDPNESWLWALVLLVLAGLGLGPRRLRWRLFLLLPFSAPVKGSTGPGDPR